MLFEYFVVMCLGFAIGVLWTSYQIAHRMTVVAMAIQESEESGEKDMLLRVEKTDDMIYCYEKNSDQFVAQGTNITEIFDHFHSRFPNRSAEVVDGPDEVLSLLRQQRKQLLDQKQNLV